MGQRRGCDQVPLTRLVRKNLELAQEAFVQLDDGDVLFPAGRHGFHEHLEIKDDVVLCGSDPRTVRSATSDGYDPPTKFEFAQYEPSFQRDGTRELRVFRDFGCRLSILIPRRPFLPKS